jgi:hypothetical protein
MPSYSRILGYPVPKFFMVSTVSLGKFGDNQYIEIALEFFLSQSSQWISNHRTTFNSILHNWINKGKETNYTFAYSDSNN